MVILSKQNFILTLPLITEKYQEEKLHKRFEIGRQIYNACLGEVLKRYNHLRRQRIYKATLKELIEINKEIARYKKDEVPTTLEENKGRLAMELYNLRKEYGVTEYSLHEYAKPMCQHFYENMDSSTGQKIASRAWGAVSKVIFGKSKRVYFKKYGSVDSLEGKSNRQGIILRNNKIKWKGLELPIKLKLHDIYAYEALQRNIKYCRIIKKQVRSRCKFYVQLVIGGTPPSKRNNNGSFKQKYGESRVGIDPSLQSIAVVSETKAMLRELAPSLDRVDKELPKLQRKLDRSRRANNPNKYKENGEIKRGNKDRWILSKSYLRTLYKIREINRLGTEIRKQEHNKLANQLLELGTTIYVEKMDFRALAKRGKETKIDEKTGRCRSKKRFGKSIGSKAPGMFLTILGNKLGYLGKKIKHINTWEYKASQYNHVTDEYVKKSLSERWVDIGDKKIQRDLYSAFLIMNSKANLQEPNKNLCKKTYANFVEKHDEEIERILSSEDKLLSSYGITKAI